MNTSKEEQSFDVLEAYAKWYSQEVGHGIPLCPASGVSFIGKFRGIVLDRRDQFQTQLWICDPNSEIPDHSHPNVDSIQVYISGEVFLRLNGRKIIPEGSVETMPDGLSNGYGTTLRVRPNDTHGATIGPMGGSFLTFQHWLNGKPESVENDWIGNPLCDDHAKILHQRTSKV